jgi:hypothetical protein
VFGGEAVEQVGQSGAEAVGFLAHHWQPAGAENGSGRTASGAAFGRCRCGDGEALDMRR